MAACSSLLRETIRPRPGLADMAAEGKMLVRMTALLTALARRCAYLSEGCDRSR